MGQELDWVLQAWSWPLWPEEGFWTEPQLVWETSRVNTRKKPTAKSCWLMSLWLLLMLMGTVTSIHGNGSLHQTIAATHLPSVVLSLQLAAVLLSWGETCHYNAAGPEKLRSAAGYTPHKGSTPHPDLENSTDQFNKGKRFSPKLILKCVSYLGKKSFGRKARELGLCSIFLDTFLQRQGSAHSPGAERGQEESSSLRKTGEMGFIWALDSSVSYLTNAP